MPICHDHHAYPVVRPPIRPSVRLSTRPSAYPPMWTGPGHPYIAAACGLCPLTRPNPTRHHPFLQRPWFGIYTDDSFPHFRGAGPETVPFPPRQVPSPQPIATPHVWPPSRGCRVSHAGRKAVAHCAACHGFSAVYSGAALHHISLCGRSGVGMDGRWCRAASHT